MVGNIWLIRVVVVFPVEAINREGLRKREDRGKQGNELAQKAVGQHANVFRNWKKRREARFAKNDARSGVRQKMKERQGVGASVARNKRQGRLAALIALGG